MKGTNKTKYKISEICKANKIEIVSFEECAKSKNNNTPILKVNMERDKKSFSLELYKTIDLDAFEKVVSSKKCEFIAVYKKIRATDSIYTLVDSGNINNAFVCTRKFINSMVNSNYFIVLNHHIQGDKNFYNLGETDKRIDDYIAEVSNNPFLPSIKRIDRYYIMNDVVYGQPMYEEEREFPLTQIKVPDWVDFIILTRGFEPYSLKKNFMKRKEGFHINTKSEFEVVCDDDKVY